MRPYIVITYPFPIGRATGGARMTREIARNLGRLGADVILLPISASIQRRFPRPKVEDEFLGFEFDDELLKDSVSVERVTQHPLSIQLDGLSVKKVLKKITKQRHVDMVLSYYHEGAFLPSFLKSKDIKFGYISTWQSYEWALNGHKKGGPIQNFKMKQANLRFIIKPHNQADILFATSQFTRDELMNVVGVDGSRVVVCPLGVESKFYKIPRSEPEKISNFIFFGRIVESKGIVDAIKALGMLAARGFTDWNFRVMGQGNHEWARNLANEHGIADKVSVYGPADDEKLENELKQAHLAIMPSHSESFGLSIAEAQAAGIPLVAYEAGSVPEVVENGVTAWLAPFREINNLSRCIEEAIKDPKAAYQAGLAGRERVKEKFTWEKTGATMFEGIQKTCLNGTVKGAA